MFKVEYEVEVEVENNIKVEEAIEVAVKFEWDEKDVERVTEIENDYLEAKDKVELMKKRRE
jgi:hypothetical protein